jgi:hypothetical protein
MYVHVATGDLYVHSRGSRRNVVPTNTVPSTIVSYQLDKKCTKDHGKSAPIIEGSKYPGVGFRYDDENAHIREPVVQSRTTREFAR